MTPTKDAAELSAERLAELVREYEHSPMMFSAKASSEIVDALRELQRLRAASARSAWQPISTAPRDESWLLLYADIFGEPSVHAGFWSEGDWYDSEAASKPLRDVWAEPTHWQRFSAPTSQPAAEEAREAECACGHPYACGAADRKQAGVHAATEERCGGSRAVQRGLMMLACPGCPDCRPAEAPYTRHVTQHRVYLDDHGDYREATTVTGPNTEAPATAPQSAGDVPDGAVPTYRLRAMAASHSNSEVRSMAGELLDRRVSPSLLARLSPDKETAR